MNNNVVTLASGASRQKLRAGEILVARIVSSLSMVYVGGLEDDWDISKVCQVILPVDSPMMFLGCVNMVKGVEFGFFLTYVGPVWVSTWILEKA